MIKITSISIVVFMKIIFFWGCVLCLFISCENDSKNTQRSYSSTGKLKSVIVFDSKMKKSYGRFFYSNGNLKKELYNLDGQEVDTMKTYFLNGTLESKLYYEFSQLQKRAFWYHSNGALKETVIFNNNEANGLLKYYLPSGKLNFINYFKNGFLHYVKYYRRDSLGIITSASENYIPKVVLNKDTISYGDSLNVSFYLDVPLDSMSYDSLLVNFDFFRGEKLYDNLDYPTQELAIDNGIANKRFIIEDNGNQILHGAIFTKKGDVEKHYKRFSKNFYVKEL